LQMLLQIVLIWLKENATADWIDTADGKCNSRLH